MFDFEKLKNIDLQNIDLQKIDIDKLIETMLTKKDFFASLMIGVVALLIAIVLTKDFFSQTSLLNADISLLKTKIETIAKYDSTNKKLKKFLLSVPSFFDEDFFSSNITDLAALNGVTVVSYVPGQKQEEDLYVSISGSFEIEAPDYPALLIFLKALEKAPFALRVDNCLIIKGGGGDKMLDNSQSKDAQKKNDIITVHLDLTSVQIKK